MSQTETFKRTSRPRYLEVARDIELAIERGLYPLHGALPSEAYFCQKHRVSRFTVREALRRLAELGLIERSQGRETRVVARSATPSFTFSAYQLDDLVEYATDTSLALSGPPLPVPISLARRFGLGPASQWIQLSGVRSAGGTPIGYVDIFVRREFEDAVSVKNPISSAMFALISAAHRLVLSHIDQTVSSVKVPKQVAGVLKSRAGDAGLEIVRHFVAEEIGLFEVSRSIHPADRFSYSFRMRRSMRGSA